MRSQHLRPARPRQMSGPGGALRPARPPSGLSPSSLSAVRCTIAAGFVVLATGVWFWATSEIAGWSSMHEWPRIGLSALFEAVSQLPGHPGDPGMAWSGTPSAELASVRPVAYYLWAAAVAFGGAALASAALVALRRRMLRRAVRQRVVPQRGSPGASLRRYRASLRRYQAFGGLPSPMSSRRSYHGARWARTIDVQSLAVSPRKTGRRLVLGHRAGIGGGLVATEERHSVLVIGPTQSGKTTGLAIPAILEWDGPVVATSVKDDLAATTLAWRSRLGTCSVFDPTRSCALAPTTNWSPLSACTTWADAQKMAVWLVESTPGKRGLTDAAFWYTAAAKQLAPLLLAAEFASMGMSDVVRWTETGDFDEPRNLLALAGHDAAALSLSACANRDERIRSSVTTTLETVLIPFADPGVVASTATSEIDIDGLLESSGTLYLCGPSHEQARVAGLFSALVSLVVARAVERVRALGRSLDPPLLVVLDEAANIAPIADLDTLASTAAGLGVQLMTVCQDLAQLAARYDTERARTIANNHRAKLLLAGVSDLGTLDMMSGLAGEQAIQETTITQDRRGGRTTRSTSTAYRRLAPPDRLRRVPPGSAVLVYGHLPPVELRLRPWYTDRKLARMVDAPG